MKGVWGRVGYNGRGGTEKAEGRKDTRFIEGSSIIGAVCDTFREIVISESQ